MSNESGAREPSTTKVTPPPCNLCLRAEFKPGTHDAPRAPHAQRQRHHDEGNILLESPSTAVTTAMANADIGGVRMPSVGDDRGAGGPAGPAAATDVAGQQAAAAAHGGEPPALGPQEEAMMRTIASMDLPPTGDVATALLTQARSGDAALAEANNRAAAEAVGRYQAEQRATKAAQAAEQAAEGSRLPLVPPSESIQIQVGPPLTAPSRTGRPPGPRLTHSPARATAPQAPKLATDDTNVVFYRLHYNTSDTTSRDPDDFEAPPVHEACWLNSPLRRLKPWEQDFFEGSLLPMFHRLDNGEVTLRSSFLPCVMESEGVDMDDPSSIVIDNFYPFAGGAIPPGMADAGREWFGIAGHIRIIGLAQDARVPKPAIYQGGPLKNREADKWYRACQQFVVALLLLAARQYTLTEHVVDTIEDYAQRAHRYREWPFNANCTTVQDPLAHRRDQQFLNPDGAFSLARVYSAAFSYGSSSLESPKSMIQHYCPEHAVAVRASGGATTVHAGTRHTKAKRGGGKAKAAARPTRKRQHSGDRSAAPEIANDRTAAMMDLLNGKSPVRARTRHPPAAGVDHTTATLTRTSPHDAAGQVGEAPPAVPPDRAAVSRASHGAATGDGAACRHTAYLAIATPPPALPAARRAARPAACKAHLSPARPAFLRAVLALLLLGLVTRTHAAPGAAAPPPEPPTRSLPGAGPAPGPGTGDPNFTFFSAPPSPLGGAHTGLASQAAGPRTGSPPPDDGGEDEDDEEGQRSFFSESPTPPPRRPPPRALAVGVVVEVFHDDGWVRAEITGSASVPTPAIKRGMVGYPGDEQYRRHGWKTIRMKSSNRVHRDTFYFPAASRHGVRPRRPRAGHYVVLGDASTHPVRPTQPAPTRRGAPAAAPALHGTGPPQRTTAAADVAAGATPPTRTPVPVAADLVAASLMVVFPDRAGACEATVLKHFAVSGPAEDVFVVRRTADNFTTELSYPQLLAARGAALVTAKKASAPKRQVVSLTPNAGVDLDAGLASHPLMGRDGTVTVLGYHGATTPSGKAKQVEVRIQVVAVLPPPLVSQGLG